MVYISFDLCIVPFRKINSSILVLLFSLVKDVCNRGCQEFKIHKLGDGKFPTKGVITKGGTEMY